VTFTRQDHASADIVEALAHQKINVRVSEQTYRYDEGASPAPRVRASVHYYNTEEEISQLIRAL
jgi:cysteine desulfurase/selenocysteine lyase